MHPNVNIYEELKAMESPLANLPAVNVFSVPEGYFENLGTELLLRIRKSETKDDADVPAGYFDNLASQIMGRIRAEEAEINEESSLLQPVRNINVYQVPPGYFENLPSIVATKLAAADTVESELLAGITKENVFSVPEGYFDSVAGSVLKQVKTPAKVISIGIRRTVISYAAAAVITGLLGFGLFTFLNKNGNSEYAMDPAVMAKANDIIKNKSFDQGLETIGEDEIIKFLESSGQDINGALAAAATDDNSALPGEDEYLFDDRALDNFLNELNLNPNNTLNN